MSKFRVGQRVRVKFTYWRHEYEGMEAMITGPLRPRFNAERGLTWMGYEVDLHPRFYPEEHQLEPATDCYDKTEWSECVWRPEHLRVGA